MVYMGISYNVDELPGNIWINNAVMGLFDGASQFAGMAALMKFGRRSLLAGCLILTGVFYMGIDAGIYSYLLVQSRLRLD